MIFVDTNVLIYAVSPAPEDAPKARRSLALLERRDLALSVQVLQEFYVQATRASRAHPLSHPEATAFVAALLRYPVQDLTVDVVLAAFRLRERFGLSYWDSAILAAARAAGCREVWSEDLDAAQDYDGLRVVNPYA